MEEVKKRGRKKKLIDPKKLEESEELIAKKRGRKKKWETIPFKNNFFEDSSEVIKFDNVSSDVDKGDYNTNKVKFGNLFINIHDKETNVKHDLFEEETKKECLLNLSSEDEEFVIKKPISIKKSVVLYNKDNCKAKCFNCHYLFENSPFYLPFDYCQELDRYKVYGNFCSPNCVKSYCINSKHFQNKLHIVGQFYRKLFGAKFRIKPAPSYLTLKDYGGQLTIEEFRESFYTNSRYTLNNINSKIIKSDIIFSK